MPLNRLVNEAVGEYLDTRAATIEAELEETLRRVKAYRQADADFESAISKFADADAESAAQDVRDRAARREVPTVEDARRWQGDTMAGLKGPDKKYVGRFHREPGLETTRVLAEWLEE